MTAEERLEELEAIACGSGATFEECPECAAKPGTPRLCSRCLIAREIASLRQQRDGLRRELERARAELKELRTERSATGLVADCSPTVPWQHDAAHGPRRIGRMAASESSASCVPRENPPPELPRCGFDRGAEFCAKHRGHDGSCFAQGSPDAFERAYGFSRDQLAPFVVRGSADRRALCFGCRRWLKESSGYEWPESLLGVGGGCCGVCELCAGDGELYNVWLERPTFERLWQARAPKPENPPTENLEAFPLSSPEVIAEMAAGAVSALVRTMTLEALRHSAEQPSTGRTKVGHTKPTRASSGKASRSATKSRIKTKAGGECHLPTGRTPKRGST